MRALSPLIEVTKYSRPYLSSMKRRKTWGILSRPFASILAGQLPLSISSSRLGDLARHPALSQTFECRGSGWFTHVVPPNSTADYTEPPVRSQLKTPNYLRLIQAI